MRTIALVALALVATSCTRPGLNTGSMCMLNSDCADPLVCQLDRCRRQCLDSRDCGAGFRCLEIEHTVTDGGMGGVCQTAEELVCTLTSDCSAGLICSFGTCTTECVTDRDCANGAQCLAPDAGTRACVEQLTRLCVYNSDCPAPEVCGSDQQCHIECNEDRDCISPRLCVEHRCAIADGG